MKRGALVLVTAACVGPDDPPEPDLEASVPYETGEAAEQATPDRRATTETLRAGEGLVAALVRGPLEAARAHEAADAVDEVADVRSLAPGTGIRLKETDGEVTEVAVEVNADSIVALEADGEGWRSTVELVEVRRDRVVVAGRVQGSIYESLAAAGGTLEAQERSRIVDALAD